MIAVLFIYLLSLVCWLGGMVFFIPVTQTAFTALPKAEAGKFLAVLFPRYYMLGYIGGAIAVCFRHLPLRDAGTAGMVGDCQRSRLSSRWGSPSTPVPWCGRASTRFAP